MLLLKKKKKLRLVQGRVIVLIHSVVLASELTSGPSITLDHNELNCLRCLIISLPICPALDTLISFLQDKPVQQGPLLKRAVTFQKKNCEKAQKELTYFFLSFIPHLMQQIVPLRFFLFFFLNGIYSH